MIYLINEAVKHKKDLISSLKKKALCLLNFFCLEFSGKKSIEKCHFRTFYNW